MLDLLFFFTGLIAVGNSQSDLAAQDASSVTSAACSFCAGGLNRKKCAFTALFDDDLFDDDNDVDNLRSRDLTPGTSPLKTDEPGELHVVIKTPATISFASIRLNLRI